MFDTKKGENKIDMKNTVEGVELTHRSTLDSLLLSKKLYDMEGVSKITGYCVRYLRRLCHSKKIDHHRFLGRYYLTLPQIQSLLRPVKKNEDPA